MIASEEIPDSAECMALDSEAAASIRLQLYPEVGYCVCKRKAPKISTIYVNIAT